MLFEVSGICQNCAEDFSSLVHNGELVSRCSACDEDPCGLRNIAGVIYVLKNYNQDGVKIGRTSKTVEQRAKQLSSTGVAGNFEPIAIFPSPTPPKHEKRIHDKLGKFKLDKEHFSLEPLDAVLRVYRGLNKTIKPIFYDDDIKDDFYDSLEVAKREMAIRLRGKKARKGNSK
jgi:hypothetical protein